jgi:hypothetical protein
MSDVQDEESLKVDVRVIPSPISHFTAGETVTDHEVTFFVSSAVMVPEMVATGISSPG